MAQLTLRNVKGSPITFDEMDSNLLALDSDSPWNVAADFITYGQSVGIGPGASSPTYHLDFGTGDSSNEATIGTSDADLHIHVDGSRELKVTTNTQERLVLTTTGNLGIGTSTPEHPLDVSGHIRASNNIYANQLYSQSFTDSVMTISGGNLTNVQMIDAFDEIRFTEFYDKSTGYRVNHIDSVLVDASDGIPTSRAAYSAVDSVNTSLITNVNSLQTNIDSVNNSLIVNINQIQENLDSVAGEPALPPATESQTLVYRSGVWSSNSDLTIDATGNATFTGTVNASGNFVSTSGIFTRSGAGAGVAFASGGVIFPWLNGATRDNEVSLGSSSTKFKDAYFGGTVSAAQAVVETAAYLGASGAVLKNSTGGAGLVIANNGALIAPIVHNTIALGDGTRGWKSATIIGNIDAASVVTTGATNLKWGTASKLRVATGGVHFDDWIRSETSGKGWYHTVGGGGWMMSDTTWIRAYGSKAVYVANQIAATGDVTAFYSDERLKEKVGTIDNALEAVQSIETFLYKHNDIAREHGYDDDKVHAGVSAQSVERVLPEIVDLAPFDYETLEDGTIVSKSGEDYKTVKYEKLTVLLIEAVKELSNKVKDLESKLDK